MINNFIYIILTCINFDTWYRCLHLLLIGASAFLVLMTLRRNQEWNRRKSTHDLIERLVTGDYTKLSKIMTVDLSLKIFERSSSYTRDYNSLDAENQKLLNNTLAMIFNLLEVLSISIKNKIIDDEICFDYLALMYTSYYRWGKEFLDKKRKEFGDQRVYVNFEELAIKWQNDLEKDFKKSLKPGKGKL